MSSFFASFTPNHVNLINACYPSSSALLASGSTFQPLPSELSRLIYYASNKADASGKLAKLGMELEKRATGEARKARGGNARARAQLLVTMSIFKNITNECKRDVGLFTRMLLSATRDALTCLPNDLELQARVASLFTAWATYTDGKLIGPDLRCTNDYITILKVFHDRCKVTGSDSEAVSRMRLVGLAAITAAGSSDAFFSSPEQFPRQVAIVIPALIHALHEADIHIITDESKVVSADPSPNSLYLSEFQPRPIMDRRAASIHAHIDGETGPELADVVNASLRALRTLLARCNAAQVSVVFDSILQHIEKANLWGNTMAGKWYVEHVIEWAQYQYRYSVPSLLVDRLLAIQGSPSSAKHFAFLEMLTCIFTSSTPLINLSTSDIISSLITILLRRISIDPNDPLLSPIVECISSLGTHVYYADQIHDLAEEIVNRIVNVQVNGVLGRGRTAGGQAREVALRCLLACLSGLSEAADRHAAKYNAKLAGDASGTPTDAGDGDRPPSESTSTTARAARRNKVSPESWQETLALLCEADYSVRAMYARGLAAFIRGEVKKEPFVLQEERKDDEVTETTPARRNVKVVVDPEFKVSSRPSILAADSISRFLNALHATAFTLAMASWNTPVSNGTAAQPAQNDTPFSANINVIPPSSSNLPTPSIPAPAAIDFVVDPPNTTGNDVPPKTAMSATSATSSVPGGSDFSPTDNSGKRLSRQQNGSRKLSAALNMLEGYQLVTPMLSDFSLIHHVFVCAHQQVPCRAVLTGVPMLLALERSSRKMADAGSHHAGSLRAIRELVCHMWIIIGEVWDVPTVVECASTALGNLQETILPQLPEVSPTRLHPLEEPVGFSDSLDPLKPDSRGLIGAEAVLTALASSSGLQAITGLDRQGLLRRFTIEWTVEGALKDSVEHVSSQDILRGDTPFLKLSQTLMHDNMSLASLARSTHGGVGVENLREALGRGSVSNLALATTSQASTLDRSSSTGRRFDRRHHAEPLVVSAIKNKRGKALPDEVREALNTIGVGKHSSGSKTLRAPFLSSSLKGRSESHDDEEPKRDMSLADPPY